MNHSSNDNFPSPITKEDFVYSQIGMALISAQRVEFITSQLLNYLTEFDKSLYGITTVEFLNKTAKSKSSKRTLGTIFNLLKLNPKLIIEDELENYLQKRNLLAHGFWTKFLHLNSNGKEAVEFCYDFGRHSNKVESFFKGFIYFLALRHVKDRDHLDSGIKIWGNDFEYFISSLEEKQLKDKDDKILNEEGS